jgi:large subunit ribosomal protein L15
MPLSRRIPKRGFKNPNRKIIATVNIKDLKMFTKDTVVDANSLRVQGLISGVFDGVKVLGAGEIDYPLSIQVDMISSGARKKIQAAGGTIIEVI